MKLLHKEVNELLSNTVVSMNTIRKKTIENRNS